MKQYQEIGQLTMQWRRHGKRPTNAVAQAARSDDSHRIVQQRPQRRAGFGGGEGVEGQADAMVICSRWGMEVISDAHPVFDLPLVRAVGLEPTRRCHRGILSPLRLPVPPRPRRCFL